MVSLHTYALCALTSLGFVAPVPAAAAVDATEVVAPVQQGPGGSITVSEQLTAGADITITYSNPAKPNQTITVEINDGDGNLQSVDIETDAAGKGTAMWNVPQWDFAVFNAPGAAELAEVIF